MDTISSLHFLLQQPIHQPMTGRLRFSLKNIRHDFQSKVGFNSICASPHGRVVRVFVRVVVDGEPRWVECLLHFLDDGFS